MEAQLQDRWVDVSFPVPIKIVSWGTGCPQAERGVPARGRRHCHRSPCPGFRKL